MSDSRQHRGPHPEDKTAFSADKLSSLRSACADLCWLLTRGYSETASEKLTGDRHGLTARQRIAVRRCCCGDQELASRRAREVRMSSPGEITSVHIDGFNVLITVEAALAGGVILQCRDACFRDMASMHGSFRSVDETDPAFLLIGATLARLGVRSCHWYFDAPVSNSGRLKARAQEIAARNSWDWNIELVPDPDRLLVQESFRSEVVATADSGILDLCGPWLNLARTVVEDHVAACWVADLSAF